MTGLVLPPPASPLYPRLCQERQRAFDEVVETMAGQADPLQRALPLIRYVSSAIMTWCREATAQPAEVQRAAVAAVVTGILEGLGEQRLDHPAMAALYLFAVHESWRQSARRLLDSRRAAAYIGQHRVVLDFLSMMDKLFTVKADG